MKTKLSLLSVLILGASAQASLTTSVPGPDDQGGMIMPMVTITATAGMGSNPTAGTINLSFSPPYAPTLKPLEQWSPGSWFDTTAAWRPDIGSPAGVGGTPASNAGNGDFFNNQYGFMFMSMGTMMMASLPTGNSLGIRLDSISSLDLQSFNYSNAANRWDEVWSAGVNSQVLWSGSMWHNYFTLPATATPGTYTAVFEVFIAATPFTGSTGFAQYDAGAAAAGKNNNFTSASVTYNFTVVPEPSVFALLSLGLGGRVAVRRRKHQAIV